MAKATRLAPEQLRALDQLRRIPSIEQFYLAGGSAIAWHLGHRQSVDLDLFSRSPRAPLQAIQLGTAKVRGARVIEASEVMVALVIGGVPVDVVQYAYPLLEASVKGPRGFPVAQLRDLAAMKLAAIARRGIKRDFWDLYELAAAGISLAEAGRAYTHRFGRTEADLYHVQRALTWFDDAEADPDKVRGLTPALWKRIRAFFEEESPRLLDPG